MRKIRVKRRQLRLSVGRVQGWRARARLRWWYCQRNAKEAATVRRTRMRVTLKRKRGLDTLGLPQAPLLILTGTAC